ncbi:MAG: hypothetical protein CVV64_16375 [Candidatus Wallbacteria bacterium HGW-Wallbacteria-1]|jgi:hypothetical protein|uniref:DUF1638 domain-containing protein n=1 Tax=Candidatus Wallbacteria bacterium HGW-Wallbacteria-1 TaxID=2013854 RepID=A0A2N1PL00_9BACT|nr:MAG: hypothetical protein CVV64_16375 [Candidatus Wallbacteria bacterium HGW-Wallbacteria-1]
MKTRTDKPCIGIACGIFRHEIESLEKQFPLCDDFIFLDSLLHMNPQLLKSGMENLVAEIGPSKLVLIYGDCHPTISKLCQNSNIARVRGMNCCEILLGSEKYRDLRSRGYFFLLPEWTPRWKDIFVKHMGFNSDSARDFMAEMHRGILYLDTGIIPVPKATLQDISDFCGLDAEVMPIDLQPLKENIEKTLQGEP